MPAWVAASGGPGPDCALMDDLIRDFVVESLESLDQLDAELLRFEREPHDSRILDQIYRLLHTIKGTCGFLSLHRLERIAHNAEDLISRFRDGHRANRDEVTLTLAAIDRVKGIIHGLADQGGEPEGEDSELITELMAAAQRKGAAPTRAAAVAAPSTPTAEPVMMRQNVRVGVERLDHLMTMVSELVLVRNQLMELARREDAGGFKLPLQRLSHITAELQDGVMRTRMQSIGAAWSKISRTVRDLSNELGKDIRLETVGAETEIDRQILEVIKDCIVHLVRNAADHGIETPAERVAAGKAPYGTIRLTAGQEGSQIVMEISDDGRGLDLDGIRMRAFGQGLADDEALQRMGEGELLRLIFTPGFSTAGRITNLSGRGVGLDAVRTSIEAIAGTVDVINRPGRGTSVVLRMPLTLAVAAVLIVEAGGQMYALPQIVISELVRPQPEGEIRLECLGDTAMLRLRERLVPIIDLGETLGAGRTPGQAFVIVCDVGHRRFGLLVDAVHQTEDVVVKPIPTRLRHIPYFSGATILGDGSVILILEPTGFFSKVGAGTDGAAQEGDVRSVPAPEADATSLLLFRAGDERSRAVPLALVSRLIEVDASHIEQLGAEPVVQYDGALLPIRLADPAMSLRSEGMQPIFLLHLANKRFGVAVDEIVDVIEAPLRIELSDAMPGYLGSAIIQGATTPVLDVAAHITCAGEQRTLIENSVLLVEPSAFFEALLLPILEGAGFAVRVAKSAGTARVLAADNGYALAIIDLDQAEGFDLAQEWSGGAMDQGMGLIGIATRPGPALQRAARQSGVATVIAKFDRRALLATLGAGLPTVEVAA